MGRFGVVVVVCMLWGLEAQAQQLLIDRCSARETRQIKSAVDWMLGNMDEIALRLGRDGLMGWTPELQRKFVKRLGYYKLPVRCEAKKTCERAAVGPDLLGDRLPMLGGRSVRLCTDTFYDEGHYVAMIARDVAGRLRRDRRPKSCEARCRSPKFADSVALAAFSAHKGRYYSPSLCALDCED